MNTKQSPDIFALLGGRYIYRQPYGAAHPMWTQGGDMFGRVTSQDSVSGVDGKTYVSDQATIWRWRTAFQREFAARMDWAFKPFAQASHSPVAIANRFPSLTSYRRIILNVRPSRASAQ